MIKWKEELGGLCDKYPLTFSKIYIARKGGAGNIKGTFP